MNSFKNPQYDGLCIYTQKVILQIARLNTVEHILKFERRYIQWLIGQRVSNIFWGRSI